MIRDRRAVLALLTGLHFLNYIDRYVVAAVLDPMMRELELSNFEGGLLATSFLIGYFATSPLFGARADKGRRTGLIAVGVAVWSVATVASGLATGFWTLLAARAVVGVGEGSYVALAPTIIDDLTPPDRKGKALAVFYMAQPVGAALGYVLGGVITKHWGWRSAFYFTGGPGIVLALSCLLIVEPPRKLLDAKVRLVDGLRELAAIPLFRRAVAGYTAFAAAIGAFSHWGPKFLKEYYPNLTDATAPAVFGGVLAVAGVISTFLGGRWGDRAIRGLPIAPVDAPYDAPENRAAVNALLRICSLGMVIATPLAFVCFLMPTSTGFFATAFLVDLGLFLQASPLNAAVLRAVPLERRASAMAASVFAIHLFGDLWSPPALGLLKDALPGRLAMLTVPVVFGLAAYLWWPRRREAERPDDPSAPPARVHTTT
jgi:MFS family permease